MKAEVAGQSDFLFGFAVPVSADPGPGQNQNQRGWHQWNTQSHNYTRKDLYTCWLPPVFEAISVRDCSQIYPGGLRRSNKAGHNLEEQ